LRVKPTRPGFGPAAEPPRSINNVAGGTPADILPRRYARRGSWQPARRVTSARGPWPRGLRATTLAAPESTYGEKRRRENRSATCTLTVIARPQRYHQHCLRRASRGVAARTSEVLSGSAVAERHAPSSTVP